MRCEDDIVATISKSVCSVKLMLFQSRRHLAAIHSSAPHGVAVDIFIANPTHDDMLAAVSDKMPDHGHVSYDEIYFPNSKTQ